MTSEVFLSAKAAKFLEDIDKEENTELLKN